MIPLIDVTPLFGPAGPAREATDRAILAAATGSGFLTITAPPELLPATAATRAELLRVFSLPAAETRKLWRQRYAPEHPNLYRGFYPASEGVRVSGYDMGPDVAHALPAGDDDPFLEPTPFPEEAVLPGWRAVAAGYYTGMERLGQTVMRSFARSFGLAETFFDPYFAGGISTLRVMHYPVPTEESLAADDPARVFTEHQGRRRHVLTGAHVDSGFVTLLAQDGVEGLQALDASGAWLDVPPREGTLAVNFGGLLERWTGGRIRATSHRVLGPGRPRHSIPFFYEPRVDAVITPLPGTPDFAPFSYGDHLWTAMMKFGTFKGMESLRTPRGVKQAA